MWFIQIESCLYNERCYVYTLNVPFIGVFVNVVYFLDMMVKNYIITYKNKMVNKVIFWLLKQIFVYKLVCHFLKLSFKLFLNMDNLLPSILGHRLICYLQRDIQAMCINISIYQKDQKISVLWPDTFIHACKIKYSSHIILNK